MKTIPKREIKWRTLYKKIRKNGFTIIELIAVMVIIAVILGSVLSVVKGATDNSRITSAIASVRLYRPRVSIITTAMEGVITTFL